MAIGSKSKQTPYQQFSACNSEFSQKKKQNTHSSSADLPLYQFGTRFLACQGIMHHNDLIKGFHSLFWS